MATFVSEQLASQLHLPTQPCTSAQYLAADGSPMTCSHVVSQLQWSSQGHSFSVDAGVLPLKCYDMILGQDWLEECSPMWVHWRKKIMKFTYQRKRIVLKGVRPEVVKCSPIGVHKLKGLMRRKAITHCIQLLPSTPQPQSSHPDSVLHALSDSAHMNMVPEIQQLLDRYSHLFSEPCTLPPERYCDHHIELIPGAQPVNTRAYRYAPTQKIEIEK